MFTFSKNIALVSSDTPPLLDSPAVELPPLLAVILPPPLLVLAAVGSILPPTTDVLFIGWFVRSRGFWNREKTISRVNWCNSELYGVLSRDIYHSFFFYYKLFSLSFFRLSHTSSRYLLRWHILSLFLLSQI